MFEIERDKILGQLISFFKFGILYYFCLMILPGRFAAKRPQIAGSAFWFGGLFGVTLAQNQRLMQSFTLCKLILVQYSSLSKYMWYAILEKEHSKNMLLRKKFLLFFDPNYQLFELYKSSFFTLITKILYLLNS